MLHRMIHHVSSEIIVRETMKPRINNTKTICFLKMQTSKKKDEKRLAKKSHIAKRT